MRREQNLADRRRGIGHNPANTETSFMLEPGQPAPDFTVPDENGKQHSLADYQGKTLVLWFYPKADTPG